MFHVVLIPFSNFHIHAEKFMAGESKYFTLMFIIRMLMIGRDRGLPFRWLAQVKLRSPLTMPGL